MNRWILFFSLLLAGLGLFVAGLLVPAHLRAVDLTAVQEAGRDTTTVMDRGLQLIEEANPGAARLHLDAAENARLRNRGRLHNAWTQAANTHPSRLVLGIHEPRLESLVQRHQQLRPEPFAELAVRPENRQQILDSLRASRSSQVHMMLRFRNQTNTAIFPPASSASGQALDVAIGIAGLLTDHQRIPEPLRENLFMLAMQANQGGDSQRFEQALLDFMSLARRLTWGQLITFVGGINDVETLRILTELARQSEDRLPLLFSVVDLSGNPAAVAAYLTHFNETGFTDLERSLHYGSGGVNHLLERNQRLYSGGLEPLVAIRLSQRAPWAGVTVKWLLYLAGGFLIAAAMHYVRRVPAPERPLHVRGFHVAREFLFALGFLVVVLMLSEPFLAHDSQKVEFQFQFRLPMQEDATLTSEPDTKTTPTSNFMNPSSLLTLLLFFVIQALIYTACRVKLAEIRRQQVPPGIKLKLLDNEDHLFDAGLYLGFVGTIISLILVSLGIIKPSLMAAYSSTSFGIIFVSAFKIFNLRPLRRKLLLEAEGAAPVRVAPAPATPSLATRP